MREKLEILLDELQHLKKEGVHSVYYEDASLDALKALVKSTTDDENLTNSKTTTISKTVVNSITEVAATTTTPPTPAKKLNPFSPLPSDTEDVEIKTVTVNKISAKQNTQPHKPLPTLHIDLPKGDKQTQWNALRLKAEDAFNCAISNKTAKANTKIIFGTGNLDSDIFICGDAPVIEDEAECTPFSGGPGQLLTKIIQAMGLRRENIYIANIMNWLQETPAHFGERAPTQHAMDASLPYLKAQVEIVKPKIIIALGANTVNGLLGPDKSRKMGDVRGQWTTFMDIPLMITFHPSYLLRNNTSRTKRLVWEDMMKIMEHLRMAISEKQRGFFS